MSKISRRKALQAAGLAFAPQVASAQSPANNQVGRKFRAFVRFGTGASVQELTLRAIEPREVLVKTQASGVCYTIVRGALSTNNANRASIPNHSGMGIVESVGSLVKRV